MFWMPAFAGMTPLRLFTVSSTFSHQKTERRDGACGAMVV